MNMAINFAAKAGRSGKIIALTESLVLVYKAVLRSIFEKRKQAEALRKKTHGLIEKYYVLDAEILSVYSPNRYSTIFYLLELS